MTNVSTSPNIDQPTLLICDDDQSVRRFLRILLGQNGYHCVVAENIAELKRILARHACSVALCDLRLGTESGIDALKIIKKNQAACEVIMLTAFATADTAVEAMKIGAIDYLNKPFKNDELLVAIDHALSHANLKKENAALKKHIKDHDRYHGIVGKSQSMQQVFAMIDRIAASGANVLIRGESGTGKELVAKAIHARSPRSNNGFVPVNCGAIPATLIESELFGHKKGSFTGAHHDKVGLFVAADKGTLFLDEIGELALNTQVVLLRSLQEKRVKPVGDVEEVAIDTRVISATHRPLEKLLKDGSFREDLYYRLNVIPISIPPLRDRGKDIVILANFFLERQTLAAAGRSQHASPKGFTEAAIQRLSTYEFPGNVRQLENMIERAVALCPEDAIDERHLFGSVGQFTVAGTRDVRSPPAKDIPNIKTTTANSAAVNSVTHSILEDASAFDIEHDAFDLDRALALIESNFVNRALKQSGGNRKTAAKMLNINQRSLRYRIEKSASLQTDDA